MSGKSFANWESSYDISSFDFLILPPDPLTLDVWRGGVIVGSLEFSNCHTGSQADWSQLGDRVFFTLFCYLSSLDRRELETTILAFSYIQEGTMISSRQSVCSCVGDSCAVDDLGFVLFDDLDELSKVLTDLLA